jgi:hypothetical protein
MVLVSQGIPGGSLTPNIMDRLKYARASVLGLWICAIARIIFDNPFNGIATLFSAVCGTYTFMNDPRFTKCYEFMSRNCVICGPGGAPCLGPFMSISLINAIFDIFRFPGQQYLFWHPFFSSYTYSLHACRYTKT